jgi:hypothetical protein
MHTEINLKSSELNSDLLNRIKEFLKGRKEANVKITISDEEDYSVVLNRSVQDARQKKNLVSFTLDELMSFEPGVKK